MRAVGVGGPAFEFVGELFDGVAAEPAFRSGAGSSAGGTVTVPAGGEPLADRGDLLGQLRLARSATESVAVV